MKEATVTSPLEHLNSEWAIQQVHRIVSSSACFSFFVVLAFSLTMVAVFYQPPEPWLLTSSTMAKMLNSETNATFQKDDTIIVTGEDPLTPLASPDNSPIPSSEIEAANKSAWERAQHGCDVHASSINCTDPGVLLAIRKANVQHFPDIKLTEYLVPVQGLDIGTCDVAFKFKPRKEKSMRVYRDFRRYTMAVDSDCNFEVYKVGGWHSGTNAKPYKPQTVNDSLSPPGRTSESFRNGKYLYYSGGSDYCKGMNQFLWSFLCALGEAQFLNRTLVVDLDFCLSKTNNPGHEDEPGKDLRFYFDYEHLKDATSVIEKPKFLNKWSKWKKRHSHDVIVKSVEDFKVTPMEVKDDQSIIVWRKFGSDIPWYRVCEGETEKVIQRPWHLMWKSRRLTNIASSICGRMGWDFDSVHVVRGEKAENKALWPNLDMDTWPEALVEKLSGKIEDGRILYIATNELLPGYFDKLRAKYKIYLLDDFKDLWGNTSQWHNETMELTHGKFVPFDGYMRAAVDSEVFFKGKKRVETFGELTTDCKDGIHTC